MPFIHSIPVRSHQVTIRGTLYKIGVYRAEETGELRAHVLRNGEAVGPVKTIPGRVAVEAAKQGHDVIQVLIANTVDDINSDLDGKYS
jgi:hypothetical protein